MINPALLFAVLVFGASTEASKSHGTSTTPAATTLDLFIGPGIQGRGFVGSIVEANVCGMTIGIVCTSGHSSASGGVPLTCDIDSTIYATYAASRYEVSTRDLIDGAFVSNVRVCDLKGSTKAVCSATSGYSVTSNGHETDTTTSTTLSGDEVVYSQVPITAGVGKLSNLAACTTTSSSSAAAATGIAEVYKVLIVPGVALLAGGLV